MFRAILGVIVGYVVIFIWVAVTLAVAWVVLGSSFAYEEGTLETTVGWCLVMMATGVVGATLGGLVTALVAPSPTRAPVKVLAGFVLVLGIVGAVWHLIVDEPAAEPSKAVAEMTMYEAASESVAPTWYNFGIPVVGAAGVLIGGSLRRRPAVSAAPEAEPGE
jgi:hypothetical protein